MTATDSYDALSNSYNLSRVQVWALASVPGGPLSVADVQAVRTPHDAASLILAAGTDVPQTESFVALEGTANLVHPDGSGPLVVAGVAVVGMVPAPYLLGIVALPEPVVSPAPGYTLPITLDPMAFAAEE